MLFAGQNNYWGKLEDSTKLWLAIGIKHVMIKPKYDTPLIEKDGKLREEDFKRMGEMQKKYNVKYHIHPYNLVVKNRFMTPADKNTHSEYKKILQEFDEYIQKYSLYPLITIHPGAYVRPENNLNLDENTALENAAEFFQNLKLKSKIAVENMFDPYRNGNHLYLGYKAQHFRDIIKDKNIGLCLDTGHLVMQKEPIGRYLKLPYPIYSMHLNGNDAKKDIHFAPSKDNIVDFVDIVKAMRKCEGPIVLEVANHDNRYAKEDLEKCYEFWEGV